MINVDKTLSPEERATLKSLVGRTVRSIDAALAAPPNIAWNTVRLHTDAGSVDVSCLLQTLPVNGQGDEEEFGVVSVAEAADTPLEVPTISADTQTAQLGFEVTGIDIVNDSLSVYVDGAPTYRRTTTKTIVLRTEGDSLAFDRQAWFDEMLAVNFGKDDEDLVFDEWADFEDDETEEPGVHYEFSMAWESL